jgi:hypothetical protein
VLLQLGTAASPKEMNEDDPPPLPS